MTDTGEITTFMGDESLGTDPATALDRFTDTVSDTALIAPCSEGIGQGRTAALAFVDAAVARSVLETGEPQAATAHVMGRSNEAHLPGAVVPSEKFTTGLCFQNTSR
ncbi:hypothetical protein [Rhodovulum marinum]|uniref:hypothetical protein n=1 Tax=Rhodovulum marinum TaxID=320662 RepID=UPI001050A59B|nr:hypothetical protein [Rhodovulum marinum]